MSNDIHKVESALISLIPDNKMRKLCLSVFLEALLEANKYGANKWGTYYAKDKDRLRLVVGSLIVMTLHAQGIWMTLDQQLLSEEVELLKLSNDWNWDSGRWSKYKKVPSKNGYYTPSDEHIRIWPVIRRLHFSYIGKVANKFSQLSEASQRTHMPQVLAYLRQTLNQYVPDPVYSDSKGMLLQYNPLREIEQFQNTYQEDLSETEREAIVQSRIGQGKFRADLISYWNGCAVTGCQRIELLRASHIKPWRDSTNEERLDVYNGLLLIPNLDVAFDNGMISFSNDGNIIISAPLSEGDKLKLAIYPDMQLVRINERHHKYLEYHRNNVFNTNILKKHLHEKF
ncbi:HNH endonuclease [candidate division KSB1 bacterium]|nr:HNH endonuclease [candidate division KSB1 bacterium]